MGERRGTIRVALDLLRAQHEGRAGFDRRQHSRLNGLRTHARANSHFYRRLYEHPMSGPGVQRRRRPTQPRPDHDGVISAVTAVSCSPEDPIPVAVSV